MSELRDVAPPGPVEGGFGGSHREIVEMVLSFSVVYAAVAMVRRFRVLEALLEIVKEMWANSLSVRIEVNVIADRADISLELTNTRVSRRAALMPQSRTNVTEPHLM